MATTLSHLPKNRPDLRQHRTPGRKNPGKQAATLVALVAGALFAGLPVLWMLSSSFKTNGEMFANPPRLVTEGFNLGAYTEILTDPVKVRFFINSYVIAFAVTGLTLLVGVRVARVVLEIGAVTHGIAPGVQHLSGVSARHDDGVGLRHGHAPEADQIVGRFGDPQRGHAAQEGRTRGHETAGQNLPTGVAGQQHVVQRRPGRGVGDRVVSVAHVRLLSVSWNRCGGYEAGIAGE